jgi:lipopolysaccharide biosynthesis glycosyltransferase
LFRVNGKVDVIITDRPLILTILYNNKYGNKSKALDNLVLEEFNKYDNLNFYITRKKPYNINGRNQTKEESDELASDIRDILWKYNIPVYMTDGIPESADIIVDEVLRLLK